MNDQLKVDISLDVGSLEQEVQVEARAVQVESASTQLGDVIESAKILALPLNGRSYIDLLGLQAGRRARKRWNHRRRPSGFRNARRGQCLA